MLLIFILGVITTFVSLATFHTSTSKQKIVEKGEVKQ